MSLGMKRPIGIAISSGDLGKFKQILSSTILFVAIITVISVILITIPNLRILQLLGFDSHYIVLIIPMVFAMSFRYIFMEALIASFRSKELTLPFLFSSLLRFPILFAALYFLNAATLSTILAYSSMIFISAGLFGIYSIKIFYGRTLVKATENLIPNVKTILKAGLSSWIPHVITVLGYQLGILTTLSFGGGATEAGKFYIPMGIFTVALFIVTGMSKVTHPLVASMTTQKRQVSFMSYSMKLAFIFTMPIVTPLLFFADNFLGLMGREFTSAGGVLSILILSIPLVIVYELVYYFLYGKGYNKEILYLGLCGNIPRIILYFLLSPLLGAFGTALAWLIGSSIQFIFTMKVAKQHSLLLEFRKYILLTAIPLAIGTITWIINMQFVISTIIIIIGSLVLYIKLRLFADTELNDLLYAGFPDNIAKKIYPVTLKIVHLIRR
jgi:O-antigen/teichoic acid export membrane protein